MRLKIYLKSENGIINIPFNYNHILSSVVYNMIDDIGFASKLHSGKSFKFFCFSQIFISRPKRVDGGFVSRNGSISFIISSPNDDLITELVNGLAHNQSVNFIGQSLLVTKCEILKNPQFGNRMHFNTLSPIIVTTQREIDGVLKEWDLAPGDDFFKGIEKNLVKKYQKFYNLESVNKKVKVSSDMRYVKRKRISINKGEVTTYHRAYLMDIILEGDSDLIRFAYDCGLSSKNSQGFGMIELYEES